MSLMPNLFASYRRAALVLRLVKSPNSAARWVARAQNLSITHRHELLCGVGKRGTAIPTRAGENK